MYTQEIICPYCGKMTIVNVADTKGKTITPCQRYWCKKDIVVITNEQGQVVTIAKKEGCFITTACLQAAGLPDNCKELQTLRRFRDEYVSHLPNGSAILSQYYEDSPQIVEAISRSSSHEEEYSKILSIVISAVTLVDAGSNAEALSAYSKLIDNLTRKYLTQARQCSDHASRSL